MSVAVATLQRYANFYKKTKLSLPPQIYRVSQEKPTNKAFPALFIHAAMIVQILLQIVKSALYFIVCVGHSNTLIVLICKQIREKKSILCIAVRNFLWV